MYEIEDKYGAQDRIHAGGDYGLISQFTKAIRAVRDDGMTVEKAQAELIGCSASDILQSHAVVFEAEASRV